jgi:hypothetical protein
MLKNKKQQVFSGTDSNQVKQDNRERAINCNLKIMDNILLLSQSDKETSSNHNQYDDDDDNDTTNDKESESELFCFNTNNNNYNKNKIINKNYKNNHNSYKLKSGYVSTSRIDQIGIINSKFNKQLNMIDIVDDQLDDDYNINNNNIIKFNKQQQQQQQQNKTENEYLQMAIHYKNLCKSYKKQLIESHKTIRELHLTLEVIERKNWIQK